MSKKHRGVIQKQFTRTIDAFSKYAVRDSAETLAERVAYAKAQPDDLVLDVACGPGTLVLAFAPLVKFARGIDVTLAMLMRAREYQQERQITNAAFDRGDAEQLPYPDSAFSLVTCQFAFHHMTKPEAALKEMLRVTRPEGRLMIVDTVAPESDEKWDLHNRVEVIRDPSHTASLRLTAFLNMFDRLGLEAVRQTVKRQPRSFDQWMLRAGLDPFHMRYREARKLIEDSMPADGTGFSAQRQNGDILIVHYEGLFLLQRRAAIG
ncbi:MAG: class I SAM-dependent methyltransferase [Terriglobia bacterium]